MRCVCVCVLGFDGRFLPPELLAETEQRSKTSRGCLLSRWEVVGSWGMAGTETERSLRDQGAVTELIPGEKSSQGLEEKAEKFITSIS